MTPRISLLPPCLFLLALFAPAAFSAAAGAPAKPVLPAVPDALKPLKAEIRYDKTMEGPMLIIRSETPLTEEQWAAVAALPVKSYNFAGKVSNDDAMQRLVKLDPHGLFLQHSDMTDAGAAAFAQMKNLRFLLMSHTDRLTPKSASALADHPALEIFSNDGKFGIGGMAQIATAKHLRMMTLQHGVSSDANVALLAHHPHLESLKLWPSGTAVLTDAAIPSLATIPNLKELTLCLSVFTYDGLKHLKDLPKLTKLDLQDIAISPEDLAMLKADLPKVTITFTAMKPEYRTKWDGWAAKKK